MTAVLDVVKMKGRSAYLNFRKALIASKQEAVVSKYLPELSDGR